MGRCVFEAGCDEPCDFGRACCHRRSWGVVARRYGADTSCTGPTLTTTQVAYPSFLQDTVLTVIMLSTSRRVHNVSAVCGPCSLTCGVKVVLASGKLVNANATQNTDLFKALKGGSNNFGIVTRFDLRVFPQGKFWGTCLFYCTEIFIEALLSR